MGNGSVKHGGSKRIKELARSGDNEGNKMHGIE